MKNTTLCSLLVVLASLASSPQGRTIEDYLRSLTSLSPALLATQSGVPGGPLEEIPKEILEEAVLLNFSRWSLQGQVPGYSLSVFEMLDSQAAFGLFTRSRQFSTSVQRLPLPVDSLLEGGTLHFWKGHFFLRLRPPPEASREDLLTVAHSLVDAIDERNLYPMSVVQLPVQDLIRNSIRFYLGPHGLEENANFPAPLRDKLGFDDYAEVAMGRYGPSGQPLFLIGYPTASLAEIYFAEIHNALQSYFSREGVYVKRSGLLISLFSGPEEQAIALLDRVRYTANVRWLYEKDTTLEDARKRRGEVVTFFGIVTQSILFSGAFIVFLLGVGLLAGLFRFWLFERFPARRQRDQMIRLDLDTRSSESP